MFCSCLSNSVVDKDRTAIIFWVDETQEDITHTQTFQNTILIEETWQMSPRLHSCLDHTISQQEKLILKIIFGRKSLFSSKLDLNYRKELQKSYILSIVLYGGEPSESRSEMSGTICNVLLKDDGGDW